MVKPAEVSTHQDIGSVEKREQILQGAMAVFLSRGYADTSMDRVAASAKVSKQTIYSYFQDKERLFTSLIGRVTIERIKLEFGTEVLEGEPEVVLRRLAHAYFKKMTDEEYLALFRIVIAESKRFPELAQLYCRTVIQKSQAVLSSYFKSRPELNLPDPEATARIFMGSLVSFLLAQEILHGKTVIPMESDRLIDSLVALLLKGASHS
jgi:AcrR family transcriptional regulator